MNLLAATLLTTAAMTGASLGSGMQTAGQAVCPSENVQVKYYAGQLNGSTQKELSELLKQCGVIINKLPGCPENGSQNGGGSGSNDSQNGGGSGSNDSQNGSGSCNIDSTVSDYAVRVVELVNKERAKNNLAPLTIDTSVTAAADTRAKEIVQSFSHTRPNGTSFSTALKEHGVSYRGSGENIAWGQKTPEEVVKTWMNSPGHRANILNSKYTKIGVGYYVNGKTPYWVQLFTY
ncbi:MAG: CAP domain-containing protein [Clostridiales bacterium]|nr:CAP domain-containing protein [Clostridiales bacterium]